MQTIEEHLRFFHKPATMLITEGGPAGLLWGETMTSDDKPIDDSEDGTLTVYRVDKKDVITEVNQTWKTFARENQGQPLDTQVVGRSLWEFIMDSNTQRIYRHLLKQVRLTNERVRFSYRCDSPDTARFMEMVITPWGRYGVEFRSRIVKSEPKDPAIYCDVVRRGAAHVIRMCSFCNKLELGNNEWVEIAEALHKNLIQFEDMPLRVICKVCPDCDKSISGVKVEAIAARDEQRMKAQKPPSTETPE